MYREREWIVKLSQHALRMIQSSSPSYPIMASLDIARAMVDTMNESMFDDGMKAAALFKQWIRKRVGRIRNYRQLV